MTDHPDVHPDVHPHLATLREAQDRALEAEGIPMVLALLDHRTAPAPQEAVAPAARAEGGRLAAAADEVREALLPRHRGSDLGSTGAVLQAVAYDDFGRAVSPDERLGTTA